MLYIGTMSTESPSKINKLLQDVPLGAVLLSSWLVEKGYSLDLQKRYRNSKWLDSIGSGAMIRSGDQVGYEGAVYALQQQLGMSIHPGGKTALSMLGNSHYLEFAATKAILFGQSKEILPTWFRKKDWGIKIEHHRSSFLPDNTGMTEVELKSFSIKVSSPARAIMECLHLAPAQQELLECYELMEGMNNLRPNLVQKLLEECSSVKVKRLFLYLAEKAGHDWTKYLDVQKIDMGQGKRSLVKNGVYIAKYKITVPKELEDHGQQSV